MRSCRYNSNFQFCLNLATAFLNGDGGEDDDADDDITDMDIIFDLFDGLGPCPSPGILLLPLLLWLLASCDCDCGCC